MIRELNRRFQNQIRKNKKKALEETCMELEEASSKYKTRNLFNILREIIGKYNPSIGSKRSK